MTPVRSKRKRLALLSRPATVYLGVNARRARRGERGLLLGARRPGRVDVVEFEPRPKDGLRALLERRLATTTSWDVVGISLSAAELAAGATRLMNELVPGDVILTERGARLHDGARLVSTSLDSRSAPSEPT